MMKRMTLFAVAVLIAVQATADCSIDLTSEHKGRNRSFLLKWNAVPGAERYVLERYSVLNNQLLKRTELTSTELLVERLGSKTVTYKYRITAEGTDRCSDDHSLTFEADARLRKATRRAIIPLVGSTNGANGAVFKTSLRLRSTRDGQRGRLVFHYAGVPGNENDPSIPYSFERDGDVLNFDDVVAAFGATGLGSIDIVPDDDDPLAFVPQAEVRLFNVDQDGGTFGTIAWQVQPFDYMSGAVGSHVVRRLSVVAPGPELRLNIGLRVIDQALVFFNIRRRDENGELKTIAQTHYELSGDNLFFGSVEQIIGQAAQPGDVVEIQMGIGGGVPLYSLTDNRTNDPALFYPPSQVDLSVDDYEIPLSH